MSNPESSSQTPAAPPKKNVLWVLGAEMILLANSVVVQKWGAGWPNVVVFGMYALAALCLAIYAMRLEHFRATGGSVLGIIKIHPVSLSILALVLLVLLWTSTTTVCDFLAAKAQVSATTPAPRADQNPPALAPTPKNPLIQPNRLPRVLPAPAPATPKTEPGVVIGGDVRQETSAPCSPAIIGSGNTNNLNCGPPKYMSMVDTERAQSFVALLRPLQGKTIAIFINASTNDAGNFGEFVAKSANQAGLLFDPGTPSGGNIPIFGANVSGISISYPDEKADEAKILIDAFHNSGITANQIPRVPGIGKPGILGLYICPME